MPSLSYGFSSPVFIAPRVGSASASSSAPPPYVPPPRSAPTYPYPALATVPADNNSPPPAYQPSNAKPVQESKSQPSSSPWRETTPDLIAWNAFDLPGRKAWAKWRARRSGFKEISPSHRPDSSRSSSASSSEAAGSRWMA